MNLLIKLKEIIPSKFYFSIFYCLFLYLLEFLEIIGVGIIFPIIEVHIGKESFVFENKYFLNICFKRLHK